MRTRSSLQRPQSGFTLIELIIVIVVIGILAAVAIPKLSGMTDEANKAKNTAVLGALKSAWIIAFAKTSGVNPTAAQIVAEMADPTCTAASNVITCTGTPAYTTTFTYTPTDAAPKPGITCTTPENCK